MAKKANLYQMAHGELGLMGLGRMGGGLALRAIEKGMRVVGYPQMAGPSR
jgi:6-phosphogluconate dehydrogenase (decarboxylating)